MIPPSRSSAQLDAEAEVGAEAEAEAEAAFRVGIDVRAGATCSSSFVACQKTRCGENCADKRCLLLDATTTFVLLPVSLFSPLSYVFHSAMILWARRDNSPIPSSSTRLTSGLSWRITSGKNCMKMWRGHAVGSMGKSFYKPDVVEDFQLIPKVYNSGHRDRIHWRGETTSGYWTSPVPDNLYRGGDEAFQGRGGRWARHQRQQGWFL